MDLEIGDRLLVTEPASPNPEHLCRVVAARGPDGSAPYVVLRYDTGSEEVLDTAGGVGVAVVPDEQLGRVDLARPTHPRRRRARRHSLAGA